tara:strand:+ start:224 stop:457 length:234 start_codon:yes stop_codon:yes gene_type:complete
MQANDYEKLQAYYSTLLWKLKGAENRFKMLMQEIDTIIGKEKRVGAELFRKVAVEAERVTVIKMLSTELKNKFSFLK